jgi:Holliday junction resolvase RusA-like endonuclease
MNQVIAFFVPGNPIAQPRPRACVSGGRTRRAFARVYDSGTADNWKRTITIYANPHRPKEPLAGPIAVDLIFRLPRPKSHFNRHGLKPGKPYYHTAKPDRDNLDKAVLDALTKVGMWHDDAQVCRGSIAKAYGPVPGVHVTIETFTDPV